MTDRVKNGSVANELAEAEQELSRQRKKVYELRKSLQPKVIGDYNLKTVDGITAPLTGLFGIKNDLIVVHNMGKSCPYCTLWTDGFNGVHKHFEDRAAFAVVTPDKPTVVKEFAEGRGWNFNILSNDGGPFTKDMGYEDENGGPFTKDMGYEDENGDPNPGISIFHRDPDGTIRRVSHAPFGPGDDFCALWHIFDMLKDGVNGWQPKFSY